jgi:DNA-binding CsgD family transcriptional regulator
LVLKLYRGSRSVPASDFQDAALEAVKQEVPFSSAIWGRAGMEEGVAQIYSVHLHGLPPESLESYARFKDRDVVGAMAMRELGRTIRTSAHEVVTDREMLEQHVRRFGLEHALTTCIADPHTLLLSFITLFRPQGDPPFSEAERGAIEALAPHLVESCHQSRLMQLAHGGVRGTGALRHTAACDSDYVLIAAQPAFLELARREWPQWNAPRLPQPVREALRGARGRHVGERVTLTFDRVSDLYWMNVRDKAALDTLGRRQLEIARLCAKGQTYKEIAKGLSLAPATVRNHLETIYRKLDIGSRAELATILSKID